MQEKKSSAAGIVVAIIVSSLLIAGGALAAALIVSANSGNSHSSGNVSETTSNKMKSSGNSGASSASSDDNPGILSTDHVRGKRNSKVLVVEYADPQCPGCATMMPKMDEIFEQYKDKVAFVYRHFPISGHQNAVSAAVAIEAAGRQGYFWEMLSAVFAKRAYWVAESGNNLINAYVGIFESIAKGEGDSKRFRNDLDSAELKEKVSADKELGRVDEIAATPTIFVNGEAVDFTSGNRDPKAYIIDAINEALGD